MIKPRTLGLVLVKAAKTFPAVVVTGPRQSGKTTLLKTALAKNCRFISLEDPDVRIRAKEDPLGWLEEHTPPVIIDEIQYFPELLSYIKTKIDQKRKPGQWFLTGSQNFTLMQGVSQSLAGRAAVLSLLPFSLMERIGRGHAVKNPDKWLPILKDRTSKELKITLPELILRGSYPEIASKPSVDRNLWCGSYISTYLERDVRTLANIGDLSLFEKFLKLCAIRTGQLLNLSELAKEIGVSVPTIRRWLSILETSCQVYLLYPYYKNLGKTLVKAPKLYFIDTGLAAYLLGLHDRNALLHSPNFGNLFETLIVTDLLKRFLHCGRTPSLYYLRTHDGLEVDLVIESNQKLHIFEIKSTMTILPRHASSLVRLVSELGSTIQTACVISQASFNGTLTKKISHLNWKSFLLE